MENWEKEFDKKFIKYIDWNFVISNNNPIKIGIRQLKDFIQNLLDEQKAEIQKLMKDTLSINTLKEKKELDELYNKMDKL